MDAKKLLRDGRAQFSSFLMIVITGKWSKVTQFAVVRGSFLAKMRTTTHKNVRNVMRHRTEEPYDVTWRVFCAIEIPEEVRAKVAAHVSELSRELPEAQASWSRPENMHLTLKFLGEISQTKVLQLSKAASRAVSSLKPFRIRLEQTGSFPTHGAPRVLWIGISDSESKLEELHARLEDECAKEGFEKETRRYHPHLTIARLRKPKGARTLAAAHQELEFKPSEILVPELLVIRSELGRGGSKYTVISRHPLALKADSQVQIRPQ